MIPGVNGRHILGWEGQPSSNIVDYGFVFVSQIVHFDARVMGFGAAEATGLGFVCFVVINPRVLLSNRVDFGLFFVLFYKFSI